MAASAWTPVDESNIQQNSGWTPVDEPMQPPAAGPHINMQTSLLPDLVRAGATALPVAGGMGGAIVGAPAFGAGGLVGAGLGAAGGESLRQLLMNKVFGEGPTPTSKQGLTQTAIAGGVGAASEVPGAIATTLGNRAVANIAKAGASSQTGNAVRALEDVAPVATSAKGMTQDLEASRQALVSKLNDIATRSTGTADVDALISNARQQAMQANATVAGTAKRFEKVIAAAKVNAGIPTNGQASAQQLLAFQKELSKPAYQGNPGPVQALLKNLLGNAYGGVGTGVRQLAPESDALLSQLSDIYAAKAGVKSFAPNIPQALTATAALHPRTTALASPVVTGAALAGSQRTRKALESVAGTAVQ